MSSDENYPFSPNYKSKVADELIKHRRRANRSQEPSLNSRLKFSGGMNIDFDKFMKKLKNGS